MKARNAAIGPAQSFAELHEELCRLPEKYRTIVLCHLEGLSNEQAAIALGVPVRTIQRRLAQGARAAVAAGTRWRSFASRIARRCSEIWRIRPLRGMARDDRAGGRWGGGWSGGRGGRVDGRCGFDGRSDRDDGCWPAEGCRRGRPHSGCDRAGDGRGSGAGGQTITRGRIRADRSCKT